MKSINIYFGTETGIMISIDENLPIETIEKQLNGMMADASKTILKELFIPIKERQLIAKEKRDARRKK